MEGDASFLKSPALTDIKRNFEYESKRKITLELHLVTLCEYYKEKRIPRGMRAQLKPIMFATNPEFLSRFEAVSTKYALDVLLMNMDFLQGELAASKKRVLELDTALSQILPLEDYIQHIEKLNGYLAKFRTETEDTKKRNWQRDLQDYSTGKIYGWNNQMDNLNNRKFRKRRETGNNEFSNKSGEVFLGARMDNHPNAANRQEEAGEGGTGATRTRRQTRMQTQKTPVTHTKTS